MKCIDFLFSNEERSMAAACGGYSDDDLQKIGRFYNILIEGQLKSFLSDMGRTDGGVIGDSLVQLYRPTWSARTHLIFQLDFFTQLQELGFYEFLNKPFVFSFISETQYYFVQTSREQQDAVYHYDSNEDTMVKTEWDLFGFLAKLKEGNSRSVKIDCVGDLIAI
jgi:hypothetical protein